MAAIPWLVVRDKEKEGQEEEPGFVTEEGAPRIDTKAGVRRGSPTCDGGEDKFALMRFESKVKVGHPNGPVRLGCGGEGGARGA